MTYSCKSLSAHLLMAYRSGPSFLLVFVSKSVVEHWRWQNVKKVNKVPQRFASGEPSLLTYSYEEKRLEKSNVSADISVVKPVLVLASILPVWSGSHPPHGGPWTAEITYVVSSPMLTQPVRVYLKSSVLHMWQHCAAHRHLRLSWHLNVKHRVKHV